MHPSAPLRTCLYDEAALQTVLQAMARQIAARLPPRESPWP